MENLSFLSHGLTLGIAIVGAVLGIINTWITANQNRVKLKVIPQQAVPVMFNGEPAYVITTNPDQSSVNITDNTKRVLAVEIINFSSFPVIISEVGINYWWAKKKERGLLSHAQSINGETLFPFRLASRENVITYHPIDELIAYHKENSIKGIYAKTSCHTRVTGTSPALKHLLQYFERVDDI